MTTLSSESNSLMAEVIRVVDFSSHSRDFLRLGASCLS